MIRRLGGFRRRGFPALASVSIVTALACGGAITGCGGDDNGGGTEEGDASPDAGVLEGGPDAAKEASVDSGKDAAKEAASDGAVESSTPDGSPPDSSVTEGGTTPTEAGTAPTEGGTTPTEGGTTPTEGGTTPTDATVPEGGTTPPDATVPTEGGTTPTEGGTTPTDAGDAAAPAPVASFPTSAIGLGLGDCGGTAITTDLVVKNVGGGTLTVGATVAGTVFSVTPASLSLTAGASGTLTVKATVPPSATAGATLTGSLSLTTNDTGHLTASIPLSATAQGVTLAWAPASADFGFAPEGVADTAIPLTLTNTGNAPATGVAFSTPTNAQFSLTPTSVASIGPSGGTATLSAGFLPNTLNPSTATSNITFAGAVCGTSVTSLVLSGQGALGVVSGWPSTTIDFGGGPCGGPAPASQTFVLTNSGHVVAHIASATFGGPTSGYTTSVTAGTAIAADGGTLTITVTPPAIPATSAVPGDFSATLTLMTDVPGDSSHVVNLQDEAIGAILTFDTSATAGFGAFGPVSDGSALPQAFNVVNTGNAVSHVTLATTTPFSLGNAVFDVQGEVANVPQPFADTATFTPTTPGPASAQLTISGDNLCAPLPAALSLVGVGEGGFPFIPTGSLTFAANCGTAAAPQTFTITNTGNLPMTWTAAGFDPTLYSVSPTTAVLAANPNDPTNLSNVSTVTVTPLVIPSFPASTLPSAFASQIHITTDVVGDTPHIVTLSETPLGDVLTLVPTPSPLDFGQVPINTPSNGPTFNIVNASNPGSSIAVVQIAVTGPDAPDFVTRPATLIGAGSQSGPIGITFNAPGVPNPYSASVGITTSDVLCAPIPPTLPLTGTATEAGPDIQPPSLTFGNGGLVNCGATAAPLAVTVTNTGTQDFTILSAASNNSIFGVTVDPPDGVVEASNGNAVTITVTPGAIPATVSVVPSFSTFSGSLTITTDANSPTQVFVVPLAMGAEGVIVPTPLSTTTWAFGSVPFGSSSTFSVQIQNTGNEDLQASLTNLDTDFTLTGYSNVLPGTTQLRATFTPSAPGTSTQTDNGTLTIAPTPGGVFCEPLPPSWAASLTLSGSSF